MGCTGFSEGESLASSSTLRELLRDRPNASGEAETDSDELLTMLLEVIASAQRAYPTFRIPPEIFATYVLDRLPADVAPLVALQRMYTSDLYLACGCACGEAPAIAAFEEHCLGPLDRVLASMGVDHAACADVTQEIRSRVLVGNIRQARRAEILDFAGRGDLRGWIRVMAVRQALQRQERARRELPAEDSELLQQIADPDDLSLAHAKGVYREEFKRAFERALRALPDRQRTLLRQHYVDGLSIDELGSLYRVHRSTAARLVGRARILVLDATRARMRSQLGVESRDLDSILRLIWSQIDVSLRGLRRVRKR